MNIPSTVTALLATALSGLPLTGAAEQSRPNIVVILADDMHRHLPGFNGGLASTPNLDRLVRDGTSFQQFYVHAVCSPTRAAFLTGRYPFRNGMEERSHGNDTAGMLPDERTLAQALKEAGYDTALVGKWHLGNWYRTVALQRGFDHHYGLYGALVSYYGKTRDRYYDWHRNGQTVREEGYTTDLLAREVEQLLSARTSDRPFFYYVAMNAIHGPDEAPAHLAEKYRALYEQQPDATPERLGSLMAIKSAMLESMDAAVGRILSALEEKGVLSNTLVVFFNDNGGRQHNPPFRGGKGDTYEGGIRVPCGFYWPGRVPAGGSVQGMAHVVDLYPTLLKLAGGSLDQELPLDGLDLWNVITRGEPSPRTEVVNSLPGDNVETGPMSIRQGPWKLVDGELYNVAADPAETTDLALKHPEIRRRLQERLAQLAAQRRPAEPHLKIPAMPLLVFGEKENADPPPWLEAYLNSLPESAKSKKTKKKDRLSPNRQNGPSRTEK